MAVKARRPVIQRPLEPIHAEEFFAKIIAAGFAQRAVPARHDKRSDDPSPFRRAVGAWPERLYDSGDFMAQNGRSWKGDFSSDHMKVRMADAASMNTDKRFSGTRLRDGNPLN